MTRTEALETAKANRIAHRKHDLEHIFGRADSFDAFTLYGFRNGWYRAGEFSFSDDELSGIPYDIAQGGWAYL